MEITNKSRIIRFKQINAVYETLGDPLPSSEDITITRSLKDAGEIMGIKVLDHIIVGVGEYLSFVERGLL